MDSESTCVEGKRRGFERYKLDLPVRVIIEGTDKTRILDARGTDVNQRGMCVRAGLELSVGQLIQIEFTHPFSSQPLRCAAIVRNRIGYSYGLEFRANSEEERASVLAFADLLQQFVAVR